MTEWMNIRRIVVMSDYLIERKMRVRTMPSEGTTHAKSFHSLLPS